MRSIDTKLTIYRRIKKKKQRSKKRNQRLSITWLSFCIILVISIISLNFAFAGLYSIVTKDLPATEYLPALFDTKEGLLLEPTRIYDRTGQYLLDTIDVQDVNREFLSIDPEESNHFSPQFIQVTTAILDPGYWENDGISWRNFFSNSPYTIAERLVDGVLLENEPDNLIRSIRMRILAAQIISDYGKSNVLEWYLNSTYYGNLAYGAQSAAMLYLNKSAADLDLNEACLLTMISITPTLNPIDSPVAAKEIKQAALDKLLENQIISTQDHYNASKNDIVFSKSYNKSASSFTYTNLIIDQLAETIGQNTVERGGLKITTTIDHDLQNQVNCVLNTQLHRISSDANDKSDFVGSCNAALLLPSLPPEYYDLSSDIYASSIIIDLESSEILAILGDTDLKGDSGFLSDHQPGTMLTPLIAAAGFTRGMSPATLIWDIPHKIEEEKNTEYSNQESYHGPQRVRMAIANDYIASFQDILNQIGPNNISTLLKPFGIENLIITEDINNVLFKNNYANIIELAQAYSVFANLGTQRGISNAKNGSFYPRIVRNVQDASGNEIFTSSNIQEKQILGNDLSYLVHHILADDTARWPSLGYPNPLETARPSAGKTGYANLKKEVWTIGYTPHILIATWVGFSKISEETIQPSLNVEIPAGIWYALTQYASKELDSIDWEQPAGISTINVCDPSGLLPTTDCPSTVSEIFLSGNEPIEADTLFGNYKINKETGLLATVFTPLELVEERSYMNVPSAAQEWAKNNAIDLPPSKYDSINPPPPSPEVNISEPSMYSYVSGTVEILGTASGDNFESYNLQIGQGLNPQAWLQVKEKEGIPVSNNILGTWETSQDGLYAIRLIVLQDENNIESDIIQVTVDNTPPNIQIHYPQSGQIISSLENVSISLKVDDYIGIDYVELYIDGEQKEKKESSPYIFSWTPIKGEHTIYAIAYDLAGNKTKSEPTTFTIN